MSVRTTSDAVISILRLGSEGGDYDDANDPSLIPYIESAASVVDDVVTNATAKGVTLSAAKRELIERWLAAHMYCLSDQTYAREKTGDAEGLAHGQTGMFLESTRYGQNALMLDPSGCLRELSNGKTVTFAWLGLAPSEQTDYEDRD